MIGCDAQRTWTPPPNSWKSITTVTPSVVVQAPSLQADASLGAQRQRFNPAALGQDSDAREFGLFNVPRTEVGRLFRELVAVADGCKFGNCLHRGEPGCAAAAAVEVGTVAPWRLESYLRMLETLPDVKAWEIRKASES